jgi:hypothetical protein
MPERDGEFEYRVKSINDPLDWRRLGAWDWSSRQHQRTAAHRLAARLAFSTSKYLLCRSHPHADFGDYHRAVRLALQQRRYRMTIAKHDRQPAPLPATANYRCFIVRDATGQALGYLCFDDEPSCCLSQKIHAKIP